MFVITNGIQRQQNQVQGAKQALDEPILFYFSRKTIQIELSQF